MSFVCSCYLSLQVLTSSPTPAPFTYLLQQCNWAKLTLLFIEKAMSKIKNISSLWSLTRAEKMLTVIVAWHPFLSQEIPPRPPSSCLPLLPFLVPACSRMVLDSWHPSLPNWERCTFLWEIFLHFVQLGPNPISGPHRPHPLSHVPGNKTYHPSPLQ